MHLKLLILVAICIAKIPICYCVEIYGLFEVVSWHYQVLIVAWESLLLLQSRLSFYVCHAE